MLFTKSTFYFFNSVFQDFNRFGVFARVDVHHAQTNVGAKSPDVVRPELFD